MTVIFIGILAFVAVMISLYPLFQGERRVASPQAADLAVEALLAQREATYGAIKDLDFDRAQGKLSEADYTELRGKYEARALTVLQQLQSVGHFDPRAPSPSVRANGICPQCGAHISAGDHFCRFCDRALSAHCQLCGAGLNADDHFCRQCGTLTLISASA